MVSAFEKLRPRMNTALRRGDHRASCPVRGLRFLACEEVGEQDACGGRKRSSAEVDRATSAPFDLLAWLNLRTPRAPDFRSSPARTRPANSWSEISDASKREAEALMVILVIFSGVSRPPTVVTNDPRSLFDESDPSRVPVWRDRLSD